LKELILASKSPRRRELMALLGHKFRCEVSGADESIIEGETPEEHVTRLSLLKARHIGETEKNAIIIGSDTIVVLDGRIFGKPSSEDEAVEMLSELRERTHTVYTGFALYDTDTGNSFAGFETTEVKMRNFSDSITREYVATGEPMDKAGAYGIQGYGAVLIEAVNGCYFNVMGFPLARVMEALYNFTDGRLGYFGKIKEILE